MADGLIALTLSVLHYDIVLILLYYYGHTKLFLKVLPPPPTHPSYLLAKGLR